MSYLLEAEKLRRRIQKLERKRDEKIEKARGDYNAAVLALRENTTLAVLELLDKNKEAEAAE